MTVQTTAEYTVRTPLLGMPLHYMTSDRVWQEARVAGELVLPLGFPIARGQGHRVDTVVLGLGKIYEPLAGHRMAHDHKHFPDGNSLNGSDGRMPFAAGADFQHKPVGC